MSSSLSSEDPYSLWEPLLEPLMPADPEHVASQDMEGQCRICLEPPTDPCLTRCGHLYCLGCLQQWLAFSPKCPACKTKVDASQVILLPPITTSSAGSATSPKAFRPARSSVLSDPSLPPLPSLSFSDYSSSPSTDLSPRYNATLLASPPPIRFTSDERALPRLEEENDEWDTDAELDFQLHQADRVLRAQPPPAEDVGDKFNSQPFSRALSVAALALMMTVLLKQ